ncbi:carboxypeptidase-like regulatory domain-containing protein [Methanocella sp. MCL-LM]|uniref:carboxypeptidase-like regulatory domain-containing protein n=1 Tax=Methanocella sp. MCL-LM TaxID=3412035 RepID=UPI003C75D990
MKIELNGIPLDGEEEGGEGRSVTHISTVDARNTEAYDAPGGQSSSYSDLGRSAVKIIAEGIVSGKNSTTLLEGIWGCFKKGDPVEFNSDISGAADITKVLIDSMIVKSVAGNRNRFDYVIELWEYREPPEEPEGPVAGDTGLPEEEAAPAEANQEAEQWANEVATDSSARRNELTGVVLDPAGNPTPGVTVVVAGCGREIEVQTDDRGEYRVKDLDPGDYSVKVKEEGYENAEEMVTVG